MLDHWPTKEELQKAQINENTRAMEQDDEPDPICECGQLGYVCMCDQLAAKLAYWSDGAEYLQERDDGKPIKN